VKKRLVAAFAVAAFCCAPAFAAPPAPMFNWTGFYAGLNAGYGWGDMTTSGFTVTPNPAGIFPIPPTVSPNGKGFLGGFQAGYNYQTGRFIVGLESDYSFSGIAGTGFGTQTFAPPGIGYHLTTVKQEIPWFTTVRARLGISPADRFLIFASAGLAYGKTQVSNGTMPVGAGTDCTNTGCAFGSTSGTSTGWAVSAGFEYALWQNVTIKSEYLFIDLGSRSMTYPITLSGGSTVTTKSDFQAHIVRTGLNFKY
jgi:outer membrane immunogenic protein